MSLTSPGFALFLALALALFHLSPGRWRAGILLLASLAFYGFWNPLQLALLLAVTAAVFALTRAGARRGGEPARFRLAMAMVAGLLTLLAVFKCGVPALRLLGSQRGATALLAPLGLSYYLFKMISYILDVYWETLEPVREFIPFCLYVSFFPQMVSGPIQRPGSFLGQLDRLRAPDPTLMQAGLRRILFGLFKKLVIADRLADTVAQVHGNPAAASRLDLLLVAYLFPLQLYADFSGLTDIALGIGALFGLSGPENFNEPFRATDLADFWRRWHMSLTSWLTDYLFTPLRMRFRHLGTLGLALAIFLNMLAVGVWHGPTWTYAAFGALNGLLMIGSALTLKPRLAFCKRHPTLGRIRAWTAPLATFHLMLVGWILFRAESFRSAMAYFKGLAAAPGFLRLDLDPGVLAWAGASVLILWAVRRAGQTGTWLQRRFASRAARWTLYYAA
ncbi:MAG: MBOAT family O-acyltransferase, partial [Holophaga sp.]|nr:MBOAT family O-acyltransferase [Holophaga sp.]